MKKTLYLLLLVLFFFFYSYAHSGRTDANGGHYNRATGEYHYHTGEYAGQDSSGSISNDKSYFYKEVLPSKNANPYKTYSPPSTPPDDDYSAVIFTWCFFGVLFYIFLLKPIIKVIRKNSASKNKKARSK